MKKRLLKTMLLLCALIVGSGTAWADNVTFDATEDITGNTSGTAYQTAEGSFTASDNSVWKANGYITSANTFIQIGKGGANYLETPEVEGTITSVEVTWYGNTKYYLSLQTTDGTELEAKSNPASTATETFTLTGNYNQLRLVGRRSSGTSNAAAYITKVVVTYTPSSGGDGPTPITHSLTYSANPSAGGTVTVFNSTASPATIAEGTMVSISAEPNTGYVFSGWTVSGTGAGVANASNASTTFTMGTADATLTANFTHTYTVTYAANGGTGTMTDSNSPYVSGAEVTLLSNAFTAPSGKAWSSWAVTDANSQSVTVTDGKFTMPASNVTVTAQWVDLPSYIVTLGDNSETLTETSAGAGVTLPSRSAIGSYAFAGWSATNVSSETTTAPTIIEAGAYYPTANITLYPVYTKSVGSGTRTEWHLTELSAADAGIYALLTTNGYAFTGSISSGGHGAVTSGENSAFVFNDNNVATTVPSGICEITFTAVVENEVTVGYTMYNSTYGYLYAIAAKSGNLAWHNSESSRWSNASSNWTYYANSAYLRSYSDGSIRTYANNTGDVLKLAKKVTVQNSTTYYWSAPVVATVETPEITVAENFYISTTASISCATDGATIYYSYDNSTWNEYTDELTITESKTIYAKAQKGEDWSSVASATTTKQLATPTVTITPAQGFTNDLANGTDVAAGTLTASVTYNDAAVVGATVTWESNNTSVATVNATTGAVTLLAKGTAKITASYAANSDYAAATAEYSLTVINSYDKGQRNNPYTVAEANDATPSSGKSDIVYIQGIVSGFVASSIVNDGSYYRYYISDDGTTSGQLLVYKGKKNSTEDFSDANDLLKEDVVLIAGQLTMYSSAPEVASGNYIVSLTRKADNAITVTGGNEFEIDRNNGESTLSFSATATSGTTVSYAIDTENTTLNAQDYSLSGNTLTVTGTSAGTITVLATAPANSEYKAASATITVTVLGVKADPTIVVNATETVAYGSTFTVDDEYIEGGDITVTSLNTSVATVSGLVITPVAVGTTTIRVSTAANAEYNAGSEDFTLTVTAPEGTNTAYVATATTATLSFASNDAWKLPTDYTTTAANYSDGTYTISLTAGTEGDGWKWNTDATNGNYLIMGKTNATLTLPAFAKKVTKIDVIGKSGASGYVEQNIYVYDATEEQDVAVSEATTGATGTNSYSIDENYQDEGTIYKLKITSKHNTQITSIIVYFAAEPITATLNAYGYVTFCSQYPLDFTSATGVTAWQIKSVDGEEITFEKITSAIKGGQGILLKGTASADVAIPSADSNTELEDNMLVGTLAPTYFAEDAIYGLAGNTFKLNYAGTFKANKAYIPASEISSSVRAFTFVFVDPTTGITETQNVSAEEFGAIFNLAGQRVNQPQRGVNIINGKKTLFVK